MHTREIDGIRFHYNPDLSGEVIICLGDEGVNVRIPGRVLVEFIIKSLGNLLAYTRTKELIERMI